ncbi:hypothetical protein DLAC_03501 [Tieghemostelium lacteum]|uniref:GIY-YIG domain-containing protein n=1 Tax=Tieghemostelium lacteum TaxID=361077 RepID=A0A152A1A4_TIELA|nr:hypothetical protein DLAC_03501 [Tieghemostelium lacteum]|eukprot:KYR00006.1 hypothetical protein DLAC_03501 [Tieghemostelium lacteum]
MKIQILLVTLFLFILHINCDKYKTKLRTIPPNWNCVNNDLNDYKHIARNRGLTTPPPKKNPDAKEPNIKLRPTSVRLFNENNYPTQDAPVPSGSSYSMTRKYTGVFNAKINPNNFEKSKWNPFPDQPGVYMYFTEKGEILYIGESAVNMYSRYTKHDPVKNKVLSDRNQIINCPDDKDSVGCVVCWRSLKVIGFSHNYYSKIIEGLLLSTLCSEENIVGGGDFKLNNGDQKCILPEGEKDSVDALVYANYIIDNLQTIIDHLANIDNKYNNICFS